MKSISTKLGVGGNRKKQIRFWCEDETRIGLKTITGRLLTSEGIKPKGEGQWQFKYLWLYGLIEPATGESFFYEFGHLDTICFEKFLELFSSQYPDDIHVIQLDNGAFHCALDLLVPDNIILLFQPPYCPEVNPIERLWQEIKKWLRWRIFDELDDLRVALDKILWKLTKTLITSLAQWDFIMEGLSVAGF